jgi:hypothetical protein
MQTTQYLIRAALREDISSGWVWINTGNFEQRSIVLIKNPNTDKCIYCEILKIDKNFLKLYNKNGGGRLNISENKPTLVINDWYRTKLGITSTNINCELIILSCMNIWGKLSANRQNPQNIVRITFWLSLISVFLGILSIIISLYCSLDFSQK